VSGGRVRALLAALALWRPGLAGYCACKAMLAGLVLPQLQRHARFAAEAHAPHRPAARCAGPQRGSGIANNSCSCSGVWAVWLVIRSLLLPQCAGATRFATNFIMVERLVERKDVLEKVVVDDKWKDWCSVQKPAVQADAKGASPVALACCVGVAVCWI
jgi:hypothetical protein